MWSFAGESFTFVAIRFPPKQAPGKVGNAAIEIADARKRRRDASLGLPTEYSLPDPNLRLHGVVGAVAAFSTFREKNFHPTNWFRPVDFAYSETTYEWRLGK